MNIRNPTELSNRLFSADLLSFYMITAIRSLKKPVQQVIVRKLLDTVEMQIIIDPLKFDTFVSELRKDRPMQHLCDKLRSTCGECDNVCLSTSTDQWCSGVAQLKSQHMDSFDKVESSATLPQSTSGDQRKYSRWNINMESFLLTFILFLHCIRSITYYDIIGCSGIIALIVVCIYGSWQFIL